MVPCGLLDWLSRIGRITKFIWQYFRDEILPSTRNLHLFPFGGTVTYHWRQKVGYPDEGASNEVSSLANEKFISSRNKYGLVGKQYLLALVCFHTKLEARHCIQVCWAAHKINELVAQDNKLTCRGVYSREIYIKQPPSQATT